MNVRHWRWLGVFIPVAGVALLIARAELGTQAVTTFRLGIAGVDPRSLLHGQYLEYRFDFDWQGEHGCGPGAPDAVPTLDGACCVCLSRRGAAEEPPSARQVACDDVAGCDGWLRAAALKAPQRYFIPEARAAALEQAFREHPASLDVGLRPNGEVVVGELFLGGRPWREVVP